MRVGDGCQLQYLIYKKKSRWLFFVCVFALESPFSSDWLFLQTVPNCCGFFGILPKFLRIRWDFLRLQHSKGLPRVPRDSCIMIIARWSLSFMFIPVFLHSSNSFDWFVWTCDNRCLFSVVSFFSLFHYLSCLMYRTEKKTKINENPCFPLSIKIQWDATSS